MALTATAFMTIGGGAAFAGDDDDGGRTLLVDDNRVECPRAQFQSIEAAVEAASPGDRVLVCPGQYTEQVSFEQDDNNIRVESQRFRKAIIRYPGDAVAAAQPTVVLVNGARGVTVRDFTITGPYQVPGCGLPVGGPHSGVRVIGNGSAAILGNHVTQIRNAAAELLGCQDGLAILIGRRSQGQVGRALIAGNLVDQYQKNGITVDNEGSSAEIRDNEIVGLGQTSVTANNGIQVSRQARVNAEDNLIRDNRYVTPESEPNEQAFYSAGVILFGLNGGVRFEDNRLRNNGDGFSAFGDPSTEAVTRRVVLEDNSVRGGFGSGIFFDSDTADNRIEENSSFDNVILDCEDRSTGNRTAGTANTWDDNNGRTDNRGGRLCRQDDDD